MLALKLKPGEYLLLTERDGPRMLVLGRADLPDRHGETRPIVLDGRVIGKAKRTRQPGEGRGQYRVGIEANGFEIARTDARVKTRRREGA